MKCLRPTHSNSIIQIWNVRFILKGIFRAHKGAYGNQNVPSS